jgi:RNA polymerase sigma-70 factor (ECF subfamily)
MRNQKSYNLDSPIEAWLIGIAKNTVTDYLRKTMRRQFVPLDNIMSLISTNRQPEEVIVADEEIKGLITAMTMLRDKERQILSMKFATDLKHKEIAEILNISESHVKVTAHRAMNKLKKFMKEEEL